MATLNIPSLELVTSLRTAPLNGAPSSSDYNESQREALIDLSSLADFINNQILPLMNALPDGAMQPSGTPVGIEGRTVFTDTSDSGQIFFDGILDSPLTIADSLRIVNGILTVNKQQLTDLGIEVASLQARLSSTNQNDIALALQNLTASLNALAVAQQTQDTQIAALQAAAYKISPLAPATSTSAGEQGTIAYDGDHVYVCIATNLWARATITQW